MFWFTNTENDAVGDVWSNKWLERIPQLGAWKRWLKYEARLEEMKNFS